MGNDSGGETYSVEAGINGNLGAELRVAPGEGEHGVAVVEHTLAPGEFAWYFAEAARILPDEGDPGAEAANRLAEFHEEYEFEMDPDSVPRLVERHDVKT